MKNVEVDIHSLYHIQKPFDVASLVIQKGGLQMCMLLNQKDSINSLSASD